MLVSLFIQKGGMDAVKVDGGSKSRTDTVSKIVDMLDWHLKQYPFWGDFVLKDGRPFVPEGFWMKRFYFKMRVCGKGDSLCFAF